MTLPIEERLFKFIDFSSETIIARRKWHVFQVLKKKLSTLNPVLSENVL